MQTISEIAKEVNLSYEVIYERSKRLELKSSKNIQGVKIYTLQQAKQLKEYEARRTGKTKYSNRKRFLILEYIRANNFKETKEIAMELGISKEIVRSTRTEFEKEGTITIKSKM